MNIPIDNTALVNAALMVKENNTRENMLLLLRNLVGSSFILPVVIVPEPVDNKVAADATINYFSMETSKGLVYLTVFTSGDEYEKWNKNPNKMYVIRSYDNIKSLLFSTNVYDGFVIDPCGCNIAVRNELIKTIERAEENIVVKAERVETEGNMGLRYVENPPQRLKAALLEYFKTQDNISSAYYMETIRKGEDKATPVLVIGFSKDGSLKAAFDGIAAVAHSVMEKGETIGLMPSFDKVAQKYIKGIAPFYKKYEV